MTRRLLVLLAALLPVAMSAQQASPPLRARRPVGHTAGQPAVTDSILLSTLVALDRRLWEAVRDRNSAAFVRETVPGWLDVEPSGIARPSASDIGAMLRSCETRSFRTDSATLVRTGAAAAVLNYRVDVDQTCSGQKVPTPMYTTEVWRRRDDRWQLATLVFTPVQQAGK